MKMMYSKTGEHLTEGFETCALKAYFDIGGILTIGWGHTGSVYPGQTITQAQADELFRADLASKVSAVNSLVKIPLSQNEFDALVDFVFNIGVTAFAESTMLKDINGFCISMAADEFERWDHVSGKVVAGLLRRRIAERDLFREHSVA